MLKKIIIVIMLTTSVFFMYGNDFQKANEEYSKKNYKEAIRLYNKELESNQNDVHILFNLANAYLNLNRDGEALYNFYKASLIDPSDVNIKKEINTLEEDLNLVDQYKYPLILSYMDNWYLTLTLLLLLSLTFFIFTLLNYQSKTENILYKIKKPILIILIVMFIISLFGNVLYYKDRNSGIVLNKMDVLISPYEDSDSSFTINEGTKIIVDDEFNDFLLISDQKNRYGWIVKKNIGLLWK